MTPIQARFSILGPLLLMAGVAGNALFLQAEGTGARWRAPVESQAWPQAAAGTGGATIDTTSGAGGGARLVRIVDQAPVPGLSSPSAGSGSGAGASNAAPTAAASGEDPTKSNPVATIQRELIERGYEPGPIDGVVGLMTRAAVMAYEFDEGLAITAEPGQALLKHLVFGGTSMRGDGNPRSASENARRVTRSVQELLVRLGYAGGPATGEQDAATRSAIRAFERDHGMAPTGRISGRLVSQISRAGNVRMTIVAEWN